MQEMAGILVVTVVMFAGIWLLGWAYGEHQRPPASPTKKDQAQTGKSP